jgi:prolyl oligopeptidase
MKKKYYLLMLLPVIACNNNLDKPKQTKLEYPKTKKTDVVDNYFGTKVADPYRWLEDDNSEETAEWVKQQNALTFDYLSKIPFRETIKKRLTEIWNYPKYGVPFKKKNFYFFFKNDGMQNQSVLYMQDGLKEKPYILLDPNKFSKDGTTALAGLSISKDAKYLAYSIAKGGSDWNEIFVLNIKTKKILDDNLKWVKFSGMAWYGNGFYYSRYDEPKKGTELQQKNEYHKVYFHKTGTSQNDDKLIYENKKYPLRNYVAQTTEDQRFLLLYETETTDGNALYYKDLNKHETNFKLIAKGFDYEYSVIDNIDDLLLIRTNDNAPKYRAILIDPANTETSSAQVTESGDCLTAQVVEEKNRNTIIPEKEDVLQSISLVGGKIIAEYMKDASSKAFVYNMDGNVEKEIKLPGIGSLSGFSGKKQDSIAFCSFTSFTFPSTIYKYNVNTNISEIYIKSAIDFNTEEYETKQIFYKSKDGTKIPMFITYKKGIKLNGKNPAMLYGYGGFNISITPGFSISRLIFLENGGIYAVPNIRGGGEYGEEWHKAGTKLHKQNVFDDFIAAAEYLIKKKYTSPDKLAISGGSNGGLLVGACMTQRPDLFKVALPAVGVMDMLRFHKFTIGWAWVGDYGSSDDSVQFNNLIKYSPLHNIKKDVNYPATLVTTADHDDRVVPAHSFKFISTLQEKQKGDNPVLIRIETMAGHGAGKPTRKLIDQATDILSFTFYNLDIEPKK